MSLSCVYGQWTDGSRPTRQREAEQALSPATLRYREQLLRQNRGGEGMDVDQLAEVERAFAGREGERREGDGSDGEEGGFAIDSDEERALAGMDF